jgi:hypothetical protein
MNLEESCGSLFYDLTRNLDASLYKKTKKGLSIDIRPQAGTLYPLTFDTRGREEGGLSVSVRAQ